MGGECYQDRSTPKRAPGHESEFQVTCRHCMQAPGRQNRQSEARQAKDKVRGGATVEGAPGPYCESCGVAVMNESPSDSDE